MDFLFDSKILNRWDRVFVAFIFFSRGSLENECVIYRWRRCQIPSFISLRFLHQVPQSTHTNDPSSKVLYLSRTVTHSHHIFSPPSSITRSSHSICHREIFSLYQPHSQILYPHITSTDNADHTNYHTTPLPLFPTLLTRVPIAALADIRERVTRSLPHRPQCAYKR